MHFRLGLLPSWALGALLAIHGCSADNTGTGVLPDGAVPGAGNGAETSAGSNGSGTVGSGSGAGVNDAGWPISPTFVPMFPGAGTGDASDPLVGGMLCDYVPHDGEKGGEDPLTECFFEAGSDKPAATLEQVLECADGKDSVHLRLTFDPAFVDNTYGANAIGWEARMPMMMMKPPKMGMMDAMPKAAHTWKDLVGSDHAEILVSNGDGKTVLDFSLDYISEDASSPSGYSSLGPLGGDGKVISGDVNAILDWNTSIARNFNERGYGSYTVDSPATDADYTVNADAPEWDYRVVYEAWIDIHAFGDSGFGDASIEYVHASPSKAEDNTIVVVPGKCPPDWCTNPDGCDGGGGDEPPSECTIEAPDSPACTDGGVGFDGGVDYCVSHPDEPQCMPE